VLVGINVPGPIQNSAESVNELLTGIPPILQARVEQVGTPLEFIFAAPCKEIAHGQWESGGFAALGQRIGPAPDRVHVVLVSETAVMRGNLSEINQSQVRAIHHDVVTMEIVVSVSHAVEGVHSCHQLCEC